jgi:hypothetical protein
VSGFGWLVGLVVVDQPERAEARAMSFKFQARQAGEHVHVAVWSGDEGQRAHCGVLTMRPEEWRHLTEVIKYGNHVHIDEYGDAWWDVEVVDETVRPYDFETT